MAACTSPTRPTSGCGGSRRMGSSAPSPGLVRSASAAMVGPATQARLGQPYAVAVAPDDTVYIVDQGNNRIRWLRPGGAINTLAGTGINTTSGDGGPARQAELQDLGFGLAVGLDGGVYLSQGTNNVRVRRISPVLDALQA